MNRPARTLIPYAGWVRPIHSGCKVIPPEHRYVKRKSPSPDLNRSRSYLGLMAIGQRRGWTLREIADYYDLDREYLLTLVRNSLRRECA